MSVPLTVTLLSENLNPKSFSVGSFMGLCVRQLFTTDDRPQSTDLFVGIFDVRSIFGVRFGWQSHLNLGSRSRSSDCCILRSCGRRSFAVFQSRWYNIGNRWVRPSDFVLIYWTVDIRCKVHSTVRYDCGTLQNCAKTSMGRMWMFLTIRMFAMGNRICYDAFRQNRHRSLLSILRDEIYC